MSTQRFPTPTSAKSASKQECATLDFSMDEFRPMNSSTTSDNSSRGPKAKLFHIEFSDLHVSKEDSVKFWRYQLKGQLFEAKL
jgi:hypothetical protein